VSANNVDGRCHNAQPGTFNHECGKPAQWVGTKRNGFQTCFCDACRRFGYEARAIGIWERYATPLDRDGSKGDDHTEAA